MTHAILAPANAINENKMISCVVATWFHAIVNMNMLIAVSDIETSLFNITFSQKNGGHCPPIRFT